MTTVDVIEKPILFSGAMVAAILDGRKVQTRRVIKPRYLGSQDFIDGYCPLRVGSLLWVRETFYCDHFDYPNVPEDERDERDLYYAADGEDLCAQIPECECDDGTPAWKPSIFMPRWASRITLEVTAVRVQRVQEISEEDAKAEGAELRVNGVQDTIRGPEPTQSYRTGFVYLWQSINEKRGFDWEKNPWVWAYTFKRIKP